MVGKASTPRTAEAKPGRDTPKKDAMSRIFLFVVLLLVVVLCVGGVLLGAFPPEPRVQQIQKVIPNDRFKPAG
jgi:hypothetical protein